MASRRSGSHRGGRRGRDRRVWLVVLAIAALLAAVPVVSAHADLVESTPEAGAQLSELPDELVLEYTEGVQIANVSVASADGERIDRAARVDPGDSSVVRVPLADAGNGTYLVRWEVLSVDGHTTSGTFLFVVGEEPPTREQLYGVYAPDDGDSSAVPVAVEAGLRGLLLAGVAVLVGSPVALLAAVFPVARAFGVRPGDVDRRTRLLLGGGLLAVFASAAGLGLTQLTASGPLTAGRTAQFAATELGRAWLVRSGLVGWLALIGMLAKRGAVSRRAWLGAVASGGVLLAATVSRTSHSAGVTGGLGTLADLGHLLGASLWVGGLAAVATVGAGILSVADDARPLAARLLRRFSILGVAGVGLSGATGLAIAVWHVPSVDALATTPYGTGLSVKVAAVLLAVGLGGYNRFVLSRRLGGPPVAGRAADAVGMVAGLPLVGAGSGDAVRTFVRSVRFELLVLAVVVVLSGVVTSLPTAANATGGPGIESAGTAQTFEREADGVTLEVTVLPARVGPNALDVRLARDGGPAAPDEAVSLLLRHPERDVTLSDIELERVDRGTYSTVAVIPANGTWELRVSTWVNGTHFGERIELNVSAATAGGDADPSGTDRRDGGWLAGLLRRGAVAVGLLGLAGLGYELSRAGPGRTDG